MRPSTRFATAALAALACIVASPRYDRAVSAQQKPAATQPSLTAPLVDDFQVTGTGDHASWSKAAWTPLRRRQPDGQPYDTRFKCVYSTTGIYFLIDGTDRKLTATMTEDFMDLWNEDVFEVFLWTDERTRSTSSTRSRRSTTSCRSSFRTSAASSSAGVRGTTRRIGSSRRRRRSPGGAKQSGATIQGWRAEFFIPYALLRPLQNRAAEARHAVAAERLPDGLRRGEADTVGLGAGRQLVPRIQKFGELLFGNR